MLKYDEVGYWSEVKLDIINNYATAYSKIMTGDNQRRFYHIYIDAFAGAGTHRSKTTGQLIKGSPALAMDVIPPFKEYHFIDLDSDKTEELERLAQGRKNVKIYNGDCNTVFNDSILPLVAFSDYRRALCILDPYGLQLSWEVIKATGLSKTFDIFINCPVFDMNRNVLWRAKDNVTDRQKERLDYFWGDRSWTECAYEKRPSLFGDIDEKTGNSAIAEGFRQRLKRVAGFGYVPKPLAMKNSSNATVYYLFFASQKAVAGKIIDDIFNKYKGWRDR